MLGLADEIESSGFAVVSDLLTPEHCAELLRAIPVSDGRSGRRRGGERNLFERAPLVRRLAGGARIRSIVEACLSVAARPVRCLWFDKNAESNWRVPWHQDLSIAVAERADVPGFGPWSVKAGVTHVQPPASVLERMITVRVHLDPCDEGNGALEVVPGSHRDGIRDDAPETSAAVVCTVPMGGAVIMRPLLWHASSKARVPGHRRVVHMEFSDAALPPPLAWHEWW